MTVAPLRSLSGAARTALSTSACDAPGSSGCGGAPAPRPCTEALADRTSTPKTTSSIRFITNLQIDEDEQGVSIPSANASPAGVAPGHPPVRAHGCPAA